MQDSSYFDRQLSNPDYYDVTSDQKHANALNGGTQRGLFFYIKLYSGASKILKLFANNYLTDIYQLFL